MHDSSLNLWTEGPTEFEIIYSVCCHNLKTKSLFCSSNSWIRNNNYYNNRQERKTKINTFRFLTENSHKIYKQLKTWNENPHLPDWFAWRANASLRRWQRSCSFITWYPKSFLMDSSSAPFLIAFTSSCAYSERFYSFPVREIIKLFHCAFENKKPVQLVCSLVQKGFYVKLWKYT